MTSRGPSGPTSADEFTERLRQLVAANVAGSTQLLTRFTTFVRDATEAVRAGQVGERNDAQALLSRWLDFNLASYSVLSTQSLALLNGLLSAAESTLTQRLGAERRRPCATRRAAAFGTARRAHHGRIRDREPFRPAAQRHLPVDRPRANGGSLDTRLVRQLRADHARPRAARAGSRPGFRRDYCRLRGRSDVHCDNPPAWF